MNKSITVEQAIRNAKQFNWKDYDSIFVGQYITTEIGEFVCMSKPNLYQPIGSRYYEFMQTTDEDCEPLMNAEKVKVFHH